jgi:predicted CXXCH cytochrome family protein
LPASDQASASPAVGQESKRGLRSLLGRGHKGQVAQACAVCHRVPESDDPSRLVAEGWVVHDGNLLCPSCHADGWQFPPGSTLPFRRYSDRRET